MSRAAPMALQSVRRGAVSELQPSGAPTMSKGQDTKKAVKKEPAKSTKEKKAAKQVKKSEKTKFKPQ
jgi:hypothetical protein